MFNIRNKLHIRILGLGFTSVLLLPCVVFAQDPSLDYVASLASESGSVISILLTVVVALALLLFFWGLALFIFKADDESERAKGRQRMVWGIIALFVIVSVWGIVALLRNIFGTTTQANLSAPGLRGLDDTGAQPAQGSGAGSGAPNAPAANPQPTTQSPPSAAPPPSLGAPPIPSL